MSQSRAVVWGCLFMKLEESWSLGRIKGRVEDGIRVFLGNHTCTKLMIVEIICPLCRYNGYMLYCINVD